MINNKKVMAIIPARGGSKRLLRKNVRSLAGKPLILWSIEAAIQSAYIDSVFVSTDDTEIANVAKKCGADVPELRPLELASDTATTESVLNYTLQKYGKDFDVIILLQPTSPLRTSKHIDEAIEMFNEKSAFSIVSVTQCEHSPLWANTLPENNQLDGFLPVDARKRSQELKKYYRLNGAIYIYNVAEITTHGFNSFVPNSYAYIMNNKSSIDIDCQDDFDYANFCLNSGCTNE